DTPVTQVLVERHLNQNNSEVSSIELDSEVSSIELDSELSSTELESSYKNTDIPVTQVLVKRNLNKQNSEVPSTELESSYEHTVAFELFFYCQNIVERITYSLFNFQEIPVTQVLVDRDLNQNNSKLSRRAS
ncbi:19652_t:CDS:2, partial [Racocetra fulgida]